mmetsp:Transcript_40391/g.127124  ORF Transcript_40391/g.127124 Transcript_40391/m.127124 type:complete len:99 (-) Transcript_40391:3-299(-)
MKEMCAATTLTKKEIGNAFKHVQELIKKTVQPMKASDIIPRFCSNLNLDGNVIEEVKIYIRLLSSFLLPSPSSSFWDSHSLLAGCEAYLSSSRCSQHH